LARKREAQNAVQFRALENTADFSGQDACGFGETLSSEALAASRDGLFPTGCGMAMEPLGRA